jgi:hypothetical protein
MLVNIFYWLGKQPRTSKSTSTVCSGEVLLGNCSFPTPPDICNSYGRSVGVLGGDLQDGGDGLRVVVELGANHVRAVLSRAATWHIYIMGLTRFTIIYHSE